MQAALKRGTSGRSELHPAETSVIGALAGAVTGLATTPLDVIKTRLMTQGVSRKYAGVIDCASKIARQEGIGTFFAVGALTWCSNVAQRVDVHELILADHQSLYENYAVIPADVSMPHGLLCSCHRDGSHEFCGSA
jgi:hypothetical protein